VKPSVLLATTTTPDGSTLTLHRRDNEYHLRVGGLGLMSTTARGSEMKLAELACERLGAGAKVLIGGLGLGFTLRRVLDVAPGDTRVQVAELMPEVVSWNREYLRDVNGPARASSGRGAGRRRPRRPDRRRAGGSWDAVLIDVDNGPFALVGPGNGRLTPRLRCGRWPAPCAPAGAAFWSAAPTRVHDPPRRAGFRAQAIGAKAYPTAKPQSHAVHRRSAPLSLRERRGAVALTPS
jgi:hypothetical protein